MLRAVPLLSSSLLHDVMQAASVMMLANDKYFNAFILILIYINKNCFFFGGVRAEIFVRNLSENKRRHTLDLFDIVGPIMVGPSSSHTAGAVRMGYVAGKLLGEPIKKAEILLYGSFLATGEGHGTKKAIVAGLLGMQPDDYEIADSFGIAQKRGIKIVFGEARSGTGC